MSRICRGFRGFALDRDVLEKIYRTNVERLYGAKPAGLNLERACEELRRMAAVLDEVDIMFASAHHASVKM